MFNIFGSDKKSSTTNTTTTYQHTDNSANAGGNNSIAVGAGATLSVVSTDHNAVAGALQTVSATQQEESKRYMATLEAIRSDRDASARSEEATRDAANTAIQTTTGLAQSLSAQVADSKKDPNNQTLETVAKYAGFAAVAIAAAVALAVIIRARKK